MLLDGDGQAARLAMAGRIPEDPNSPKQVMSTYFRPQGMCYIHAWILRRLCQEPPSVSRMCTGMFIAMSALLSRHVTRHYRDHLIVY